jgi:MFS family permease
MRSRPTASTTAIIAVLGYCGALVSITQTVSLPLLPVLPKQLHTSVSNVSWVATSAFLTSAIANPVLGRLGDMYGKRRVVLASLFTLAVGCVIAAMASSILVLVIGRAMQGCGIAVIPLGMSIAKETLPPEKTSKGVALVSATLGIGGGLGLPMSGLLLGWFGWHAVFWVSAGLSLIGLAVAAIVLPDLSTRERARFDVVGALWLSACLIAILLPLSKSASWGWLQPLPIGMYVAGFAGLAGWYRYEHHPPRPLVDVRLMRERPLMLVNTAGVLLGFAMFNNLYTSIALLQIPKTVPHGFGTSVVVAGLVMLPGALTMMVMSPVSARITDRYGGRTSLWIGAAVIGVGYAARPLMVGSLLAIGISAAIVNAGVGISYGAMPSVIMAFVPDSETASANAIGTLTRSCGASLSSAAVAAILTSMTVTVSGEKIAQLGAFQLAFGLSAVAALSAAAVAYRLPKVPPVRLGIDDLVAVAAVDGTSLVSRIRVRRA